MSVITGISEKIGGIPSAIVSGLADKLKELFVPKEGFLNNSLTNLKTKLAEKFNFATYEELMNALGGYVEGTLDFGGYIDISMWKEHLPTIKNFIRGFFYPLIFIGNYNFVIWLLRGSKAFTGGNECLWE